MKKILHISPVEKFMPPFISMINNNKEIFNDDHRFVLISNHLYEAEVAHSNVFIVGDSGRVSKFKFMAKNIFWCDQLIIHGLFDSDLMLILFLLRFKKNNYFWVMWGRDLYTEFYKEKVTRKFLRMLAIKSIGNIITYVKDDFTLLKNRYGVDPKYWECIAYESNVVSDDVTLGGNENIENKSIKILIGNSADHTNNHREAFRMVEESLRGLKFEVYCPLSYAVNPDTDSVIDFGYTMFGSNFYPLKNFMDIIEYNKLLDSIDVAVFAHERQQAMGNIINLIGRGKKVYIRPSISSWRVFLDLNITVFDISKIDGEKINRTIVNNNINRIKINFSKQRLFCQWKNIFK